MRKMKLLLALFTLFVGTTASWAQKDVTSQYITNATLSNGKTGWTVSNFNDPKKGNNTVGYASEAYSGWGGFDPSTTPYYLKQTITLPAGHYTLVNYSFYREGEAYNTDSETSRAKLYAGTNEKDILTLGSLNPAPSGYANSQAEGANCFDSKMYRNTVDFTIEEDNTSIEIGLTGTFSIMRSWCIAGMFELINNDIPATMDAPFDVTGYITNPGFEYRNMAGWTLDGDFGAQGNNQTFKVGGYYAEKWQPSSSGALGARSMSQTLTNLPAGFYKLTANLGGDGTYIDLNGKTVNWEADKDYTVGYVLAENEDLVITAGKTAEGTANWIHFDNFRLQFCGDVAAALTTLCDQVTSYNGLIPSGTYSDLLTNVAAKNHSYSDVDELLDAISAVQGYYEAADLLKNPYATWLALKENAEALGDVEYSETVSGSHTTFMGVISSQNTAVESATTAEAINSSITALNSAIFTYITNAVPTSGNRFDLTFLLTNPDLTGLPTWKEADGWYTDQNGGNSQVMQNDSKDNGIYKYFFEYWSDQNSPATEGFTLYLKTTLPKGVFSMECKAFAEDQRNDEAKTLNPTVNGVTFSANEVDGTEITSTILDDASISFYQASESLVKLGLRAHSGNTRNWMGIGYVKLYKVANDQAAGVYATVRTSANNVLNSVDYANVTGQERTNLAALAAIETPADYVAAIEALQEANTAFVAAKTSYDAWAAVKDVAYDDDKPYASATKYAAIATAQAATPNTAAAAATAANAVVSAYRLYVESNAMAEGVAGEDKTSLIADPNFAGITVSGSTAGGWTFDQPGGTAKITSDQPLTDGSGSSAYSYFDYNNNSNNNQDIHQVIENLAAGRYLLTVAGRGATNFNDNLQLYVEDKGDVKIPAIGAENGVFGRGWNDASLEFGVSETSNITIGVKTDNNTAGWWSATRFRLALLPTPNVTIKEAATSAPTAEALANVTLIRQLSSDCWNTFSVPFDAAIPSGWTVKEFDSENSADNVIAFKDATTIVAGKPYLVKPTADAVNPKFDNVVVKSIAGSTDGTGNYKFAAQIYNKSLATDGTIAYLSTDGTIKKLTSGGIKGLRAYFIIPAGSEGARISFGGEETGIQFVETQNACNNAIYDMQGRKVNNMKKGIYVVNGKKVIK